MNHVIRLFGFFRIASLVPSAIVNCDGSRFPLVKEIVLTQASLQMIIK